MKRAIFSPLMARTFLALAALVVAALLRGEQIEVQQVQVDLAEVADVQVAEVELAQPVADDAKAKDKENAEESIEAQFPGGAGLKTDAEMEAFLARAEECVKEDRLDLATILWQRVLKASGETVMTRKNWTYGSAESKYRKYKSIAEEIERTIAGLSPLALRQYRVTADGEAHAILAAGVGDGREQALADVVRLYFMSSAGDDAAYELACRRLDRHDFVGGARLLSKVLNEHPDPSIPRGEMLLRLALANARLGDAAAARSTLAQLQRSADASTFTRVAALIEDEVDDGAGGEQLAAADSWPLPFGGPRRDGHMKSLPEAVTADTLSEAWYEDFEIDGSQFASSTQQMQQRILLGGGFARASYSGKVRVNTGPLSREQMLEKWKSSNWLPTGQMLLHEGLVYYKKHDRVVCREAGTGKLKWMSRPSVYQPPALSNWLLQMQRSYGMQTSTKQPATPMESILFGDRLNQAMTICDGLLLSIDGPLEGEPIASQPRNNRGFNYQNIPPRSRTNFLSAYDAVNGKFKWFRAADAGAEGGKFQVGYMAAPLPHANFLLVPVSDNGTLWLHCLEKDTGKMVWRTFLSEDDSSGASPFSPIGLAVDGGDAYVTNGCGVVFAVDAMSGAVRWAVRYQRSAQGSMNMARFGRPNQKIFGANGWEEDVVIPHGRALVVFASDCDKLFALDRRSGKFIWETPRQPTGDDDSGKYCLGVLGEGLFVAGRSSLRRYDLNKDGRLMWEARFASPSHGHGVLTGDAVYMPTGDQIAKVDTGNGKLLAQVGVFSPTKEPVGNLFSDGQRLLAIGMARAYSLQDLQTRLASLARRIAEGDSEAQLQRMRLRLRGEKYDEALADLRGAHALRLKDQGAVQANRMLYEGLTEIELIDRDPVLALSLIVDAQRPLDAISEPSNVSQADLQRLITQRDSLIFAGLSKIRGDQIGDGVDVVLGVAGLDLKPHLVNSARQTLAAIVDPSHAQRIREALADERASVREVALAAAGKALGEKAVEPLTGLLDDDAEKVRLYAAIALANAGDRHSLEALGKLLDSQSVQIRSRSVQALRAMTGQRFKYMAYEKDEVRAEAARQWRQWIAADGQTAELKLPIGDSNVLLGRMLVALYSQNRVIEYVVEGDKLKKVWEKTGINQPWGADGLPNGHRLICSYNGRFAVELDQEGQEVWKLTGLPGYGSHAHRLENGNTLVACSNANKVVEYSHEKKIVWEQQVVGNPQDARRLDNGNTLVALQSGNKVVEIDSDGKVVWEMTGMNGAFSARRLDNGNTLVALSGANKVVEVSPEKQIVWEKAGLATAYDAQRLDDGHTLITDSRGYREIDSDGKTIWEERASGALRINRY